MYRISCTFFVGAFTKTFLRIIDNGTWRVLSFYMNFISHSHHASSGCPPGNTKDTEPGYKIYFPHMHTSKKSAKAIHYSRKIFPVSLYLLVHNPVMPHKQSMNNFLVAFEISRTQVFLCGWRSHYRWLQGWSTLWCIFTQILWMGLSVFGSVGGVAKQCIT